MAEVTERIECGPSVSPLALWRLLYDPRRFPEWWVGTVRVDDEAEHPTRYLEGWPDFPMPMTVAPSADGSRVLISCLVSDILTEWSLEPGGGEGGGCVVSARLTLPEDEGWRAPALREEIRSSLQRLVECARGEPA